MLRKNYCSEIITDNNFSILILELYLNACGAWIILIFSDILPIEEAKTKMVDE